MFKTTRLPNITAGQDKGRKRTAKAVGSYPTFARQVKRWRVSELREWGRGEHKVSEWAARTVARSLSSRHAS